MLYNVHMKRKKDKKIFGDFFEKMKDRLMRGRKDYYEEDEYEYEDEDMKDYEHEDQTDDDEYIEEEDQDVYEEEDTRDDERMTDIEESTLKIDLIENGDSIELIAPVPGIDPDEVDISITHNNITISTEKCLEERDQTDSYIVNEVFCGYLKRSIDLPEEIEVDQSEAGIKRGVLKITMPKINKEKKRKLQIKKKS